MASNAPRTVEDTCNTETDEETIALKKKRSRRVSFADREITSVHIFNRDEDYETPSDSSARKPTSDIVSGAEKEVLGFFRDLADSDDSKEMSPDVVEDDDGDDEDIINARRSFLRPVESPSPGSSILGSATSNDEDNFFGPVSTSFIRPGKLSDSAASDENHDVTMDSTAFSMHYRSLARSDSGGNTFEEKTPSQVTTPSDSGGSMVLTKVKIIPCSVSEKVSGGGGSNDMSLVGGSPRNYGYEKLSPKLEALLAGSSIDLQAVPVSDSLNKNTSKTGEISMFDESMGDHVDQRDHGYKRTGNVGRLDLSPEGVSAVCMHLDGLTSNSLKSLDGLIANGCSSEGDKDSRSNLSVDQKMGTPNHLVKLQVKSHYGEDANGIDTLNVEVPSVVCQGINGEVPHLVSIAQNESLENPYGRNQVKRRVNYGIDQKFDQQKSPGHGFISSLSAKQQEIYWDASKACAQLSYVTPSPKQPNSFLSKGHTKNFFTSNKSISKFEIYEPSPLASALKERIESSKLRLSKFSSTSSFNAVAGESCNRVERENADSIVANLEKNLFCIDTIDRCYERTDYVDSAGSLRKDEGANHLLTEVTSRSQLSQLQKDKRQYSLAPEKLVQKTPTISGSDSLLDGTKLDKEDDANKLVVPGELFSLPGKTLEKTLGSSTKQQCTPLHYEELVSTRLGQYKSSVGISNSHSTVATVALQVADEKGQSSSCSSLPEIDIFVGLNEVGYFHDRQNDPVVLKYAPETLPSLRSPSMERNAQKSLPGSPDGNMLLTTGLSHSEKEIPGEQNEVSPPASSSHDISRKPKNSAKRPFKKKTSRSPVKEHTHSPSRKDQHGLSNTENVKTFTGKIIVSPNSKSNSNANCCVDSGNHLDGISARNHGNSSERKRKSEESVAKDGDKYKRFNRSPEIHTIRASNLEHNIACDNTRQNTRSDKTLEHCIDILQKFSKDTEKLFSPLIEKYDFKLLLRLQDIVLHLQKVKFLEMIHSQIQPQKMSNQSSEIKHKRVTETKMLLYKLAYEKARLQLMCMEHEIVLKKSQQLSSAVHKSQMLKLNRPCLFLSGDRDSTANNLRCTSNMSTKIELSRENLAAMKHEFEALNRKIKILTKYFGSLLKMKEPSYLEIVAQLNAHLKKKTCCQVINEDLQLWEVDDYGSMHLKRSIALNYKGLFCQRFVINDGPTPSVSVSNNLDGISITKNFPNMDACTAFAWVLNTRSMKENVSFASLAQETQITCSLLHNLFDVIGEVQLSLVEICNLVHTRFHSSAEQLQLQLCFIDFNNHWKLTVSLDLTCLNCGVYPSEIVPYQLEASLAGRSMPVPESLSSGIAAAVDGLGAGYSRIIRLCRSISQVVCAS